MNAEVTECYDILGLSPGASAQELKVAYRDLAKVWHPDRFLHDPRLREKAQEKLKEINEAYDTLRSGRGRPQPASTNHRRRTAEHSDQYSRGHDRAGSIAVVQRVRWQLILAPLLIFGVVFLATYRSLRPTEHDPNNGSTVEQLEASPDSERQQPGSRNTAATQSLQVPDRNKAKSHRDETDSASTSPVSAEPLRPLPTVTVEIDPYTRMIARADCPVKSTMTYPTGNEPQRVCNAVHAAKASRLKSVAKRLASPARWFGNEANSNAGNKDDPKSP